MEGLITPSENPYLAAEDLSDLKTDVADYLVSQEEHVTAHEISEELGMDLMKAEYGLALVADEHGTDEHGNPTGTTDVPYGLSDRII